MLVAPPDDATFAQGDAQRLTQVVLNLISNAIKYSQKGGSVKLRISWARKKCRSLSRHGSGALAEKLGLLFAHFERLGTETTPVEGVDLAWRFQSV